MSVPSSSGIPWIDSVFNGCVDLLVWGAGCLGMSYKEINVWIFCVIWPAFTLLLIGVAIWQQIKIRRLRRQIEDEL